MADIEIVNLEGFGTDTRIKKEDAQYVGAFESNLSTGGTSGSVKENGGSDP